MEDDDHIQPLKATLLSDLEGKLVTGKAYKPKRKSARPKPVGKNPPPPKLKGDQGGFGQADLGGFDQGPLPEEKPARKKKKKEKDDLAGPKVVYRPGRENDKKARQPTMARMRNIALYQISQRELSQQGLRDILTRRMIRWLNRLEPESAAEHRPLIIDNMEALIKEVVKDGMIDDRRYAEMKARGWRGRGWGSRRIEMELRKKGIGPEDTDDAIRAVDSEELDIEEDDVLRDESERLAAERLAQKKRIGPFRREPAPEDRLEAGKLWRREAGVLARAGFGMDIIHDILSRPPEEESW